MSEKPTVDRDSAQEPEPVPCPVQSASGNYCELPGDDGHDQHEATETGGRRVWMTPQRPTRGKRITQLAAGLDASHHHVITRIDYATTILEEAELARAQLVDIARAAGESWSRIGQALGLTKQAAQQRYGPKPTRSAPGDHPDQLTLT